MGSTQSLAVNVLSLMALSMIVGTLAYGRLDIISPRAAPSPRSAAALPPPILLLTLAIDPGGPLWWSIALLCLFGLFRRLQPGCHGAWGWPSFPDELAGRSTTALNTALMGGAAIVQAIHRRRRRCLPASPWRRGDDGLWAGIRYPGGGSPWLRCSSIARARGRRRIRAETGRAGHNDGARETRMAAAYVGQPPKQPPGICSSRCHVKG